MTPEELYRAAKAAGRVKLLVNLLYSVFLGVCLLSAIIVAIAVRGRLLALLGLTVIGVIGFLPLLIVLRMHKAIAKHYGLWCRHCGTPFTGVAGEQTIVDGRCAHCDRKIIEANQPVRD